ncbi:glycylpeptide N-tetradecanoyltransferase 2-like [Corticium candelabrum]|uniref:glycylpeptide N-tetradecanoyltransferase 2-like n=1 Tax=Corticium candelabrum TaxID=121492 RepID=UPI002E2664F0|nr:glycylpeptide N-tetradecanoyltransferase 2-like [Corticium candelabrum]
MAEAQDDKLTPSVSDPMEDGKINDTEATPNATDETPAASTASKKKRKKKKDKKSTETDGGGEAQARQSGASAEDEVKKLQSMITKMSAGSGPQRSAPRTHEEAQTKTYSFWKTQPVPQIDEKVTTNEAIEPDKTDIRQEPLTLPDNFKWDTLDISKPEVLEELYVLLRDNYVEDDDNMFRFDYSKDFLLWALKPPGWKLEWHCGVRASTNNKLTCFISAIPVLMRIQDKEKKMVEINFLCVHKRMRSKRVAPVLIREITRRVHVNGIFQAVYTAGVVLPKPLAACKYWHRSLNPKKLIDVRFSQLSRNMTMQRTIKLYKLPPEPKTPGVRPFKAKDVAQATVLLNEYLKNCAFAPIFSQEEIAHWLLPKEDVVYCYVVENAKGQLTDMFSYYALSSSVMHHPEHKTLRAVYAFYYVSTATTVADLFQDALILANKDGYDVFNALDLMKNGEFLEKLKFGKGDGNLQYYLYNWRCPTLESDQVGLVLL